jgi:chaperonin GroEL (HSP60 family)
LYRLTAYADEVQGLDQYAIRKFGEAFDVVPRTLAENSGGTFRYLNSSYSVDYDSLHIEHD